MTARPRTLPIVLAGFTAFLGLYATPVSYTHLTLPTNREV